MPELLLEILSEEIPARMQARAAADLKRLVTDALKTAGLDFISAESFVTPRRLALVVDGLPEKQADVSEERRGPKANAPEKAINGFKGSLPEGAVIEERETPKGTFLFATVDLKGQATADVLPEMIGKAIGDLPWPKSMRWATHPTRWVRPVHSLVCLFRGGVVPVKLGPVTASDTTVGHRFLSPAPLEISDFANYKEQLLDAKVVLDAAERRAKIEADAKALCESAGLTLKDDQGLLDEVTGLVEWPVVLMGEIDDAFMDLPDEVLSTSMRSHQKYFSTLGPDGKLANRFIVVANTETGDNGQQVTAGNERVLRARLSDAKFFWDQDRAQTLASRAPALKDRVFHAKLGTLDEKVDRMQALAVELAALVPGADKDKVRSAARLAKADLSTGMVGEFPELQGIMGRYYALHDGESTEVADAIAEHYSPAGPSDACPTKPVSVCVALADKIDTLVGFFAIDEKPTGSKDPYALRRAALGVIRLMLENELRASLAKVFEESFLLQRESVKREFKAMMEGGYAIQANSGEEVDLSSKSPVQDISNFLLGFFAERLKVHLREEGVRHDLIDAVFALGGEDDLVRLVARVRALQDFLGTDDGANLIAAYKRAANILRIEEKKDDTTYTGAPDAQAFDQDEEKALGSALGAAKPKIESAIDDEDFVGAMKHLAALRAPVDAFFDKVTVNADDADLRVNRLKLLNGIRSALDGVADFSKVEG